MTGSRCSRAALPAEPTDQHVRFDPTDKRTQSLDCWVTETSTRPNPMLEDEPYNIAFLQTHKAQRDGEDVSLHQTALYSENKNNHRTVYRILLICKSARPAWNSTRQRRRILKAQEFSYLGSARLALVTSIS